MYNSADEIPSCILKKLSYDLILPLSIIFNKSIEIDSCPIKWKYSFITPILKKSDPSRKENDIPISITSIIYRVFEQLITKHITLFLLKNSLLSKHQFGFISGKSLELQLLACVNKWTSAINDNKYIDMVYFNFKKSFDKVSHIKILIKLKDIGITGNILKWIECFLTNRKQSVKINHSYSKFKNVLSDVPQGSVIGPLLFMFINDITNLFT